jgi:CRISPR-associated protein Cmr4
MAQFKTYCYEIKLLSNMHVGSGDANYGIIDKLVQRDPVTDNPLIHASSLKGALREFFTKEKGMKENDPFILHVFGSDPKEKVNLRNGEYRFFSAELFLLPVRSSHQQYYLATQTEITKGLKDKLEMLGMKDVAILKFRQNLTALSNMKVDATPVIFKGDANTILEDYSVKLDSSITPEVTAFNSEYGNKLALFGENFKELSKNLPVIARNQLENGKSENLWYEEIVPHQSRFITFVSIPEVEGIENYFKQFNTELTGSLIQIGANGSIGYGLCKFTNLTTDNHE